MAELTTLARPYAEAVFQLADGQGALGAWDDLLGRLSAAAANPDLKTVLGNPKLSSGQLVDVFLSACGGEAPAEAKNFLTLLAENDRLALLPEIRALYQQMKNEREGVLEARVYTAFALEDGQLESLIGHLQTRYERKVSPIVAIDKELIGGVRIFVGDEVIDASIRGKLENMRGALTAA
jgi:F-type H+-transporting ATPase subunit delta